MRYGWRVAAVVCTLAGLLAVLAAGSRDPDLGLRSQMHGALQAYEIADAEIMRDVLEARAGLSANYDALAADRRALQRALGELRLAAQSGSADARETLRGPIERIAQVQERELASVERFKSANALLRNSIQYLVASAPAHAMSTGGAPGRAQAERLSLAVLRTLQAPADDAATLEAVAVVERVRSGPAHADVPEAIGAHADLVLRLRPQADGWLRQILDAPAQANLPALRAEVLRLTILAETRTARYRDGLVLVALVLAGYIALQVREMRRLEAARRAQELELIESSRMSMLGLLSAGVAHDIRRFSQVVAIGASFLADAFRDAVQALQRKGAGEPSPELAGLPYGEARDAVDAQARNLLDAADAARRMAEDVLKFSRPDEPTTRDRGDLFHPNESVERIARLLRDHFHRAGARLELDLDRALPAARGGAHVFEQALVNLVSNALEALPGPGRTVRVRTHARPLGTGITITVEDEGRGMAPGELARLGEAFFTTRRGRGGTGLGVTIAFSKVARLGGTMRFASTVGQGTTVTIELACADARGRDVPGGTLDA